MGSGPWCVTGSLGLKTPDMRHAIWDGQEEPFQDWLWLCDESEKLGNSWEPMGLLILWKVLRASDPAASLRNL